MTQGRIDGAVAALEKAAKGDFNIARRTLDRFSAELLEQPALGAQVVAQLCAAAAPGTRGEHLADLLGAGLDAARIARENGKTSGKRILDAIDEALGLARQQGRLTPVHSLLFAQLWSRNGLTAPAAL